MDMEHESLCYMLSSTRFTNLSSLDPFARGELELKVLPDHGLVGDHDCKEPRVPI